MSEDPERPMWEAYARHKLRQWKAARPGDPREVTRLVFVRRRLYFTGPGQTYKDVQQPTERDKTATRKAQKDPGRTQRDGREGHQSGGAVPAARHHQAGGEGKADDQSRREFVGISDSTGYTRRAFRHFAWIRRLKDSKCCG